MVDFIHNHKFRYGVELICSILPIAVSTYYRYSRVIIGWKVSMRMNTDMMLDALEQVLRDRGIPENVIHHSDRGVQYLSIRYTNRLEAANVKASVGTTGDSYDNTLAETVNGLYKMDVIEYLKSDWTGYLMLNLPH